MSKKLFVGGISWNTTEESLRDAFARFGDVEEVKIITDRESGRSRGFGFVTFSDDEAASNAVAEMDGKELDGRTIRVNEAEERRPREGGFGGGGGNFGGRRGGGRFDDRRGGKSNRR